MALKDCRECGKQVSTEAAMCPHCGVPNPTTQQAPVQQTSEDEWQLLSLELLE